MFDTGSSAWDDGPDPVEPVFDDVPCVDAEPPVDPVVDMVDWVRRRNVADGQVALAVVDLLTSTSSREALSPRVLVAGEIGPALGLGSGAATTLVDTVVALNTRLRATFAAVVAGRLDWYKAQILAEATAPLTDDQAAQVEAMVLGQAPGRTPARHADAVRRAVARVDPHGADARRRQARADVKLVRFHHGDGMGVLFARMGSDQLDTVWSGADYWARARKADGDPRTLDQLRVAALVQWAQSYLHHGDPTYCDRWCTPGSHGSADTTNDIDDGDGGYTNDNGDDGGDIDDKGDGDSGHGGPGDDGGGGNPERDGPTDNNGSDAGDGSSGDGDNGGPGCGHHDDTPPVSRPPTRHGRPAALHAIWDLASLLGLDSRCGELADSGAVLPPEAMRELVAGGVALRRMVIDPDTGELLDLTGRGWRLPRTAATELDAPVVVSVIVTKTTWDAISDGSADQALRDRITAAHPAIGAMLTHPWTADELDTTPAAYPAPTALAEFVAVRDRHPVNPTAGPTAASAADLDHPIPFGDGGRTVRDNLAATVRRWHRLKTHGGWTVQRHHRGWQWTSPRGHRYTTQPYDYRLGP